MNNNRLVYFCKGLGCNGQILFALKHCPFILPNNPIAAQQVFIDYIGCLCKTWELVRGYWGRSFVTDYHGKLHNGYTITATSMHWVLDITIFTNDACALYYGFHFQSEKFTRVSDPLGWYPNRRMFESANDLKNMLMDDLNRYNKTEL